MKVLVLGAGKMVEAILVGLQSKMSLKDFHIFSPSGVSAEVLATKVGATYLKSLENISNPDFIFLSEEFFTKIRLKNVDARDGIYATFLPFV